LISCVRRIGFELGLSKCAAADGSWDFVWRRKGFVLLSDWLNEINDGARIHVLS
jgi:hypothetical protein